MIVRKKKEKDLNPKKKSESGLASFIERPLPGEEEVVDFEKAINRELRDKEIDSHLMDVYSDKKGQRVDVSRMNIKKKKNIFFSVIKKIVFLVLIILAANFLYNEYFLSNNDINSLVLEVKAPERVLAAQEFDYEINYHNPSKYILSELFLEMQYPDNFIFNSASVDPVSGNYGFKLPSLAPGERASLKISGYILNSVDSVNLAIARLNYTPGSFSTNFKKESSNSIIISDLGFSVKVETPFAFIGQENELSLIFSDFKDDLFLNDLTDFDISFNFKDNGASEIISAESLVTINKEVFKNEKISLEKKSSFSYHIKSFSRDMEKQENIFNYRVKNKVDDFEIEVVLRKRIADKDFVFWRKTLRPELVSNDLSLTLILNGSKSEQALDFSSVLNYTLNYSNKGSKSYKDVVIMTVLEGDALDWDSLKAGSGGEIRAGVITWSKKELAKLEEIKAGDSGEINFSINLKDFDISFLTKSKKVSAYAQYSFAGKEVKGSENSSNKIINSLNSDLKLKEEFRYFDNNNYTVGYGPLPPKVGEKTSFRVYWSLENNLNELKDLEVVLNLSPNVVFVGREEFDAGMIYYNEDTNQVIWKIGLMPTSKYKLGAAFSLAVEPDESHRGKIIILSSGSVVTALDTETGALISRKTVAKTSSLDDDDIAAMNNSGIVQ